MRRRGSGSSVRKVPPPIATIWPVTAPEDRLTPAPGTDAARFTGKEPIRMSHLVRASAALAVLALAVPGGAAAKGNRSTPRRCARSRRCPRPRRRTSAASAARASRRRRSARAARAGRPSSGSARSPRTATAARGPSFIIRRCDDHARPSRFRPRPSPHRRRSRPRSPRKPFRLTLLHNNDGESKYVVGDSIANYGGITRFKTVLDTLRAEADATNVPGTNKGTVTISSGDNFLAGLNLRASFQRFDAGIGPFYDSDAIAALGYDAVTIGNHEYDFGPARARAVHRVRAQRRAVPVGQHRLQRRADPAGAARQRPDRRLDRGREGRRADRHHRRLAAGDAVDLRAAQRDVRQRGRRRSSTTRRES